MQKIVNNLTTYKNIRHLPIGTIISLNKVIQKKFSYTNEKEMKENKCLRYMGEIFLNESRYYLFFNEEERTYEEYETFLPMDILNMEQMNNDNFQELFKEEMPEMFEECMVLVEPLKEHLDKTIESACMINLSLLSEELEENLKENEIFLFMKKILNECSELKKLI